MIILYKPVDTHISNKYSKVINGDIQGMSEGLFNEKALKEPIQILHSGIYAVCQSI